MRARRAQGFTAVREPGVIAAAGTAVIRVPTRSPRTPPLTSYERFASRVVEARGAREAEPAELLENTCRRPQPAAVAARARRGAARRGRAR
ncbi:hypothetical protein [Streptomyces daghestanicus]|uniref:Uncharacterized protein n=1 Tax=Streptomyces daghestanicus TaxID=66885 RepID=A0ABQ3PZ73_9ACTN|nr:hypothetical protein [Streptomyces daghestanicus]GGU47800.1 hypothetical protein GCM10010259_43750 [Streptomyces daghestanicus]GHI30326.1 hypothetical protein Sdagh_20560 [Streptomyces daghestanicus]